MATEVLEKVESRTTYLTNGHTVKSWLLTLDHKRIGLLYLFSISLFFLIGGIYASLIRLELVYAPLFGCSRLPLRQLPALHRWRTRFHRLPGVAATCFPEAWRRDYFGALFPLHPSGIIPAGPDLADLVAT
ncbi:MAG: hypothetical protein EBZ36_18005 [Acidobacteria bacterium]|nr:hypothetical protein [Acidobacteriota bacterium]